ncbi:MAG: hypothetical protein HYX48_00495 [Chlamydiales bacterium]|nr:hypothetical protein [Chlamydiales bacterium]
MRSRLLVVVLLVFLSSCAQKTQEEKSNPLLSIQLVDRHGFSETISAKERLSQYQNVDFFSPQSYQKVLRIYGRDSQGRTHSQLTNYHPNGQVSNFLEVVDGRAHGIYREWYENGQLKLEATVIEGVADLSFIAQSSWLFEGKSQVWDDQGKCLAEIQYSKGALDGISKYYYSSGQLHKEIPYVQDEIEGVMSVYAADGTLREQIHYEKGLKQGEAIGLWGPEKIQYRETYEKDLLQKGVYFAEDGKQLSEVVNGSGKQAIFLLSDLRSVVEINKGAPNGLIQIFQDGGVLEREYSVRDGRKTGEETEFYPQNEEGKIVPRLLVTWHEDTLHGLVKTWYETGVMESQRELSANKKQGLSFAWYRDGSLMLNEEYDNDKLIKGTYFKKGEKLPTSKIDDGTGTATLYDSWGKFLKKVNYEKGKPVFD